MSVSKSRKSQKMGFTHVYDLHPFVMKPPPLIQRPSTVGGLDKRTADNYWKAYKPRAKDGECLFQLNYPHCVKSSQATSCILFAHNINFNLFFFWFCYSRAAEGDKAGEFHQFRVLAG